MIPSNNTLYVSNRKTWRAWLERNFQTAKDIWLVYPKKSSGKPRIPYNDAVEEALCFGWIDSIVKTQDEHHTIQRFTPRREGSGYSQANKERLAWLMDQGMVHESILGKVKGVLAEEFIFPKDILAELKKDKEVWTNYQKFSPAYKRIRIAYIEGARKRPEEFKKRLKHFIEKTRINKMMGFGGIEKFY